MKTLFTFLTSLCVLCVLAGCETVSVATNHDPAAPWGRYKTYTLAPPSKGQTMSPVAEAALRDSLRTELGKHGLTEASGQKADLDIVRHVFIQQKVSVQQYTDWGYGYHGGWPYGYGYYGMWPGAPMTYTDITQYHEGTMVIDFVDARTKKLVFRGVGKAVVGGSEGNAEKIREGVAKMVAEYPVAAH
jgi:hypothetical protein